MSARAPKRAKGSGPRIAIVTGAARGIGAAIALRLAEDGYDVAVVDLVAAACAQTVAGVEAQGRRGLAVGADVADEAAVTAAIALVVGRLGAPGVLINNAGVLRDRTLFKMTLAEWTTVIDVNLQSVFLMSRAVAPHMRDAGWGRIINLSSVAALGAYGEGNYSAAKAGVQGLTRTLALELGRFGITVNAVAPGFVVTDMTREVAKRVGISFEDMVAEQSAALAVGRPGEPEDIANGALYLASDESRFVTGAELVIDGGFTAR